jgi:transcriptional regulator with XRE-family HTH domain
VLGDALRRTRRMQRRTLADVAGAAKVSMPYLSEVERGRKEASSEVLAAICAALGIDLADLVAEIGSDLLVGRARYPGVVRLDQFRDQAGDQARDQARDQAAERAPGDGTLTCLLAA